LQGIDDLLGVVQQQRVEIEVMKTNLSTLCWAGFRITGHPSNYACGIEANQVTNQAAGLMPSWLLLLVSITLCLEMVLGHVKKE